MLTLDQKPNEPALLEALKKLAEAGLAGGAAAVTILSAARQFATSAEPF